ncbi:hypothetical protein D3C72_2577640 [compost metagenome]
MDEQPILHHAWNQVELCFQGSGVFNRTEAAVGDPIAVIGDEGLAVLQAKLRKTA